MIMAIDWTRHEHTKYFSAKNVGGPMDLTVTNVVEELVGVGSDAEEKVVVYVKEDDRGLVLNVGRREALRDLLGDDTDAWKGGRFRLVPGRATFQGKAVKALFVDAIPVAAKAARTARLARPAPEQKEWLEKIHAFADELDDIEPPFAPYDRYRFGGAVSRDRLITDVRTRYPRGQAELSAQRAASSGTKAAIDDT